MCMQEEPSTSPETIIRPPARRTDIIFKSDYNTFFELLFAEGKNDRVGQYIPCIVLISVLWGNIHKLGTEQELTLRHLVAI